MNPRSVILSTGSQSLHHHSGLPLVSDKHSTTLQHSVQRRIDLLETAVRSSLLREPCNTEMGSFPMLNNRHDLGREGNLLDIEDYGY
jgi:hypothetical protein